ncbi:MAG: hypothetical protein ACR2NN_25875 [Bryobacteraceae bacterium]
MILNRFQLLVLITAGAAFAATPAIRDAAHAIAAAPGGGVYAGGEGKGTVSRIGPDGSSSASREMAPSESTVIAMTTGADGSLITAGIDFVSKASSDGQITSRAQVPFPVRAMTAGPDGSVYVAGDHRVQKLDANLGLVWESAVPTSEADVIRAIGVDGTSALYVAGQDFLSKLAGDGRQVLFHMPLDTCNAAALAIDVSGSVYIAGTALMAELAIAHRPQACVAKINSDGSGTAWSTVIDASGSNAAKAIAIEPGGRIVIAGVASSHRRAGFAARIGTDGKVLEVVPAGGGSQSQLEGVAIDSDGSTWWPAGPITEYASRWSPALTGAARPLW